MPHQPLELQQHTHFKSPRHASEWFCVLYSKPSRCFIQELEELMNRYRELLHAEGGSNQTAVILRFHLSDIAVQGPLLQTVLKDEGTLAVVGQMPLVYGKLALEAYHIIPAPGTTWDVIDTKGNGFGHRQLSGEHLRVHWMAHTPTILGDSLAQTESIWNETDRRLSDHGGTVANHVLRTWFYIRDADLNYGGMVKGRSHCFDRWGLGKESHTIASTGIEGQAVNPSCLVQADALCHLNINAHQVDYLAALSHMPSTLDYSVAFERGTRVRFSDRSHYYISGTASIDEKGEVMHIGHVQAQTLRMLENVEVLLSQSGAGLKNLKTVTLYLRDPKDGDLATKLVQERLAPNTPLLVVQGAVCRPTWLVEMEGMAISPVGDDRCPDFR